MDDNLHKTHNLYGKEAQKGLDLQLKYFKRYLHFCMYPHT